MATPIFREILLFNRFNSLGTQLTMAASPVKFLFGFLVISITLWIVFIITSRLLAWILSRIVGASVSFRVGGWKCLRDVIVKFRKGAVESISVGEIRLSLRQSLVKLGVAFISRDPKLQVLICDLEVVMRPPSKGIQKPKTRRSRPRSSSGQGKWMVIANVARFLSVSVTDLVVKTTKAIVEIKELNVDITKDGGSRPNLFVKLQLLPIAVHMGEPRISCDQSSNFDCGGTFASETSSGLVEGPSAAISCEEFSLSCEFGHEREAGVIVRNVDIIIGEVSVNLNDKMLSKKKSSDVSSSADKAAVDTDVNKDQQKQSALVKIVKYASLFPEKVSLTLPKLDVRFVHQEHGIVVENNIMGILFKSMKSRCHEDVGESTRLDMQLDFSEIHLLREAGSSVMEILKVVVISFVYIPIQPTSPVRAEIDVKLGGTRCNIIMSRLKPWLKMHFSKKKKMVLREEAPVVKPRTTERTTELKAILWTCTVSAPEMTAVLHSISGSPLYHFCSQSSHVFANNVSSTGMEIHTELGELNLHTADEYQECLKESPFVMESNSGALVHVARISLNWGKKNIEPSEGDSARCKLALCVDVTGMGIYFDFKRLESLVVTAISFQALLKSLSASGKRTAQSRAGRSSKISGKGIQVIKLNMERCSINYCGETSLENAIVADPKRVNYGSQGGRVVISVSDDGSPRTASVISTVSGDCEMLKYSLSLEISHFILCVNKENQSTEVELQRARSIYQEHRPDHRLDTKVTTFDMHNAKFVRRSGGLKGISICSLFSATNITARWEPDLHISIVELILRLKLLVHTQKLQGRANEHEDTSVIRDSEQNDALVGSGHADRPKKKETIFAIDVEMLNISAAAGDGVDATLQVQSIFSENARIGVLLEGLMLSFNGARIFRSGRMQISRIPRSSDANLSSSITWDWVIQGLDVRVSVPYRLELRAIDDSVEDMLRALKLVTAAKTQLLFPLKKESSKPKKPSSAKFGCVKFCIRKLVVDIEEEPLQGWLDEHYQLMKNEACELAVRLKFLDEFVYNNDQPAKAAETNDSTSERKVLFNGIQIDLEDPSAIQKVQEEIYRQSFRSYYQACQKLKPCEGSGACREGFQSGFKPSSSRASLLSISASDLEVSLKKVDGGDDGMIEVLKKLDPVCREENIPFSRLYGSNIQLHSGTLAVQIRNYTYPLFAATGGKCEGCVVLAQQATCFQPQVYQDVFIGRWRKVNLLRSASGTTPPTKSYFNLPLHFQKAEVSFGVGYEPSFADISYAFSVALRRANLSVRNPGPLIQPPKKERSLPWWDDMRNYIHGNITLVFSETKWHILATSDPYEKLDKLLITSSSMEIQQSDGLIYISSKDFKFLLSSLESLANRSGLKLPTNACGAFFEAPIFTLEVTMDWDCDSGTPLNHYLFALPVEGKPREKILDPFRSTSLSLRWNFSLRPSVPSCENQSVSSSTVDSHAIDGESKPPHKHENVSIGVPTINVGAHDLAWILKFWNLNYLPPHKLRFFSRWPRFGVPRIPRSGNLSLDRVMTEFFLRLDATPTRIKYMPLDDDDPAKGLTFNMTKLKYELCFGRGENKKYTFECKRDTLDLVYQGFDLHVPKVILDKENCTTVAKLVNLSRKNGQPSTLDKIPSEKRRGTITGTEKHKDDGFLLSCDYFTVRRQTPKADPKRLLAWQGAGRRDFEMTYVRSEFENGSESDDHTRSDRSDDDNVLIADNCQQVFVYGLKLLWTLENRDAVWSFVGGLSKAFQPPKPSPSRQYTQRKLLEEKQLLAENEVKQDGTSKPPSSGHEVNSPSHHAETSGSLSPPSDSTKIENSSSAAVALFPVTNTSMDDFENGGTRHFQVNVIEPQFNLHSEEANGRFLLAAVSGRVLARSFHSVLQVGQEIIEQAFGSEHTQLPEIVPEMTWKRSEFSVMLEHVQAHVAPTDVDPGAGVQWLPKIRKNSPKVKRTGALLERVFMPCDMYFRYTRHKGGTPELKVKPLKELSFNTENITATMTSRQFQVMLDVLTNLLFARLPKPRKSSLSLPAEDDDDVEEEADEVVPDGVEEVELAKVNLEQKEREQKLLLDDIRRLSPSGEASGDQPGKGDLWMVTGGRPTLVQGLKRDLSTAKKSKKAASVSLRLALQKAAQQRLMEKEKNKSPSYAMRISLQISKVVWSMLLDGKSFAEAEINDMMFDFDRDYKDVGVALFTTKYFVVRNCLPNAKSDMVLSAWNPPPDWGKKVMLRVDAKQGLPRDGNSRIELFQVEIYPLKIHLTETMYRMMWEYFFPEEEQDSQRRQEVWKVSTTAGARRLKKGSFMHEAPASYNSSSTKEADGASKLIGGSGPELRRTSSFDRTWEESLAESVANELVLQAHSSSMSSKSDAFISNEADESSKSKLKDSKATKSGRSSHEDKKIGKSNEEKRSRPRKVMEFNNIKISQVELQITYESSRFNLHELKLLMDTFHRVEFTGTWRRLFSRVKKHVVWGTLKSVTGMQGKKFKDKTHSQREPSGPTIPDIDLNFGDIDGGQAGKSDQLPNWIKRPSDGAGDGFVTSIRGLFNTQRRKAKAFVLRTMRGEENEYHGDWSESEAEFSPFARQLTITKAKKLIRRHTKKFGSQKGSSSQQIESLAESPRETTPFEAFESDSSSESYEDFHEQLEQLKGDFN